MKITLREAERPDLEDLRQLFADTIRYLCSQDYTTEQIEAWISSGQMEQNWTAMMEEQYVLLAEQGDEIVGFGSLKDGQYIDFLYVHHAYQGMGIAKRIYDALETEAYWLGHQALSSDVSETARPFFEKQGFVVSHRNEHHLKGVDVHNYRMEKKKEMRSEQQA